MAKKQIISVTDLPVYASALLGGGLMYAASKKFNTHVGVTILLTTIGLGGGVFAYSWFLKKTTGKALLE